MGKKSVNGECSKIKMSDAPNMLQENRPTRATVPPMTPVFPTDLTPLISKPVISCISDHSGDDSFGTADVLDSVLFALCENG